MCLCACVCMCMSVCVCLCVYVCMSVCGDVRFYIYIYMYAFECMSVCLSSMSCVSVLIGVVQPNTVIIDVRNTYEADIGRFTPVPGGAEYIDPKVRPTDGAMCWGGGRRAKVCVGVRWSWSMRFIGWVGGV